MPYKAVGKKVYHKKAGVWKLKQVARTPARAKATVRLLYGLESGEWKPTRQR